MEDVLKTALAQAPGLVVLTVLVLAFFKRDKERDGFILAMHNDHVRARAESRTAIRENAQATTENAVATTENTEVLRSIRDLLTNQNTKR